MSHCIYHYNPVEIAFSIWINNYPESPHPLTDKRFFSFVLTCCSYKNERKKWTKGHYFLSRCKRAGLHRVDYLEHREEFLKEYAHMVELEACSIKRTSHNFDYEPTEYLMCYADKNGKLLYVDISKEEFKNRGITLNEMKKRQNR